jgi:hypothetical protein
VEKLGSTRDVNQLEVLFLGKTAGCVNKPRMPGGNFRPPNAANRFPAKPAKRSGSPTFAMTRLVLKQSIDVSTSEEHTEQRRLRLNLRIGPASRFPGDLLRGYFIRP